VLHEKNYYALEECEQVNYQNPDFLRICNNDWFIIPTLC